MSTGEKKVRKREKRSDEGVKERILWDVSFFPFHATFYSKVKVFVTKRKEKEKKKKKGGKIVKQPSVQTVVTVSFCPLLVVCF